MEKLNFALLELGAFDLLPDAEPFAVTVPTFGSDATGEAVFAAAILLLDCVALASIWATGFGAVADFPFGNVFACMSFSQLE